jgi:hypothetical protein
MCCINSKKKKYFVRRIKTQLRELRAKVASKATGEATGFFCKADSSITG